VKNPYAVFRFLPQISRSVHPRRDVTAVWLIAFLAILHNGLKGPSFRGMKT
jgi:hypothetical protein